MGRQISSLDCIACKPSVELQNVHFGYESDEEVLHGLSFAVQKGEQVTLTGRTGAGKSTIFKLLLRSAAATSSRCAA